MTTPRAPAPPNWLHEDAQRKWRELYPQLDHSRVRGPALDTLAMYCQAYADWRTAVEKLAHQGVLMKDGQDRIIANPYVEVRDACMANMQELGKQLGIRPDEPLVPVTHWGDVINVLLAEDDEA